MAVLQRVSLQRVLTTKGIDLLHSLHILLKTTHSYHILIKTTFLLKATEYSDIATYSSFIKETYISGGM